MGNVNQPDNFGSRWRLIENTSWVQMMESVEGQGCLCLVKNGIRSFSENGQRPRPT